VKLAKRKENNKIARCFRKSNKGPYSSEIAADAQNFENK
jgi:hypothetical protein